MEQPLACVPSGAARQGAPDRGRRRPLHRVLQEHRFRPSSTSRAGASSSTARTGPPITWRRRCSTSSARTSSRSAPSPNGININDGVGATQRRSICKAAVLAHEADIGIALDGDGDRLLMVDRRGPRLRRRPAALRDRDGLSAPQARSTGGVVGTLMTQPRSRAGAGARRHRARPRRGRRPLRAGEAQGEGAGSSAARIPGHILCLDKHTTGDAIIAALARAALAGRAARHARQRRAAGITLFPQRLINVRVPKGYDWKANDAIRAAQAGTVTALGDAGRVLLRPFGHRARVARDGRGAARPGSRTSTRRRSPTSSRPPPAARTCPLTGPGTRRDNARG